MDLECDHETLVQVGHLGEAYQEWVHQPIVSKEGPRFFQNNILEVIFMTCVFVSSSSIVCSDKLIFQFTSS